MLLSQFSMPWPSTRNAVAKSAATMEQRISLRHSEYEPRWACYLDQGKVCSRSGTGDLLFSDFFQKSLIIESMIRITKCPSCGSTKIKRVSRDWRDEHDGVAYVVPDLE